MLEQKTNNLPKIVVGGLIYQNKKILICQRKKEGDHPLKWEFPGGKLKDSENNKEALKRELKEELSIEVNEMIFFDEYLYEYKKLSKNLKLVFFQIFQFEGEIQNKVHQQLKWTHKIFTHRNSPRVGNVCLRRRLGEALFFLDLGEFLCVSVVLLCLR